MRDNEIIAKKMILEDRIKSLNAQLEEHKQKHKILKAEQEQAKQKYETNPQEAQTNKVTIQPREALPYTYPPTTFLNSNPEPIRKLEVTQAELNRFYYDNKILECKTAKSKISNLLRARALLQQKLKVITNWLENENRTSISNFEEKIGIFEYCIISDN